MYYFSDDFIGVKLNREIRIEVAETPVNGSILVVLQRANCHVPIINDKQISDSEGKFYAKSILKSILILIIA